MAIRINNIGLSIDEDMELLESKAAKKLGVSNRDFIDFKIIKESIDARKKNDIRFNYTVDVTLENEETLMKKIKDKDVRLEEDCEILNIALGEKKLNNPPVVVGIGPSGLFAALILARLGYKPLIIERGQDVDKRSEAVDKFWDSGTLNIESNVQFGEGGAGTFSDGKLTTRIKDKRCDYILKELVDAGAPKEIIYKGKPHIGTDILKIVVKNIRKEIISLGGKVLFEHKLEGINAKEGKLKSIMVNGNEIPCESLILAIGHSSRDTYEVLNKSSLLMEPKAFAIGVRVEHKQEIINYNQYGKYANHPRLKAADYRLAYNSKELKRSVYSFCMCPGGEVVAASSEENMLAVNGMSYYKRDKENANSAIVVTVSPEDFEGSHVLRGMEFQRHYERLAYKLGGGGYIAPVQLIEDFLKDKNSTKTLGVDPSYRPGYQFRDLNKCLPSYVSDTIKEGMVDFERKIKGFAGNGAVMTGIETRTSAPIKIVRDEKLQSLSIKGLYPAGEGAGFAGGIISAAVDGLKVAEELMKEYAPIQ